MIVIQPRMTGGFWLVEPASTRAHPPDVPTGRDRRATVWYCDTRRLGKIALVSPTPRRPRRRSPGRTARTPWRSAATTWPRGCARTARGIKPTLMDQKVLAGIGNIYADEILFAARIHPERPASAPDGRRGRPAARGDRRGPGRGDRRRGLELRRRLSHRAGPGRGLPGPERHVRPGRPALPRLRRPGREDQDRRPDRPPDLFLPALPAADWPDRTIGDGVCLSDCSS